MYVCEQVALVTQYRKRKLPPALKHGAYANAVLPGEDARAYEKLLKLVRKDFKPEGIFEEEIISDLVRHLWRKRNISTYRLAALVTQRFATILQQNNPSGAVLGYDNAVEREQTNARAVAQAREELGEAFTLVQMGTWATLEHCSQELAVEDRLDAMIDRSLKRLLLVRGFKSLKKH